MLSLPNNLSQFADTKYWEKFSQHLGNKEFEWYGDFADFSKILCQTLRTKDEILNVGCGNSNLSFALYSEGYTKLINIDISDNVIKVLNEKCIRMNILMPIIKMDVLKMTFPDDKFDVVLDKGTLDALAHGNDKEIFDKLSTMWDQIVRVLKMDETEDDREEVGAEGDNDQNYSLPRYVCITLAQGHVLDMIGTFFFPSYPFKPRKTASEFHVHRFRVFVVEKGGEIFPFFVTVFYVEKGTTRSRTPAKADDNSTTTMFESVEPSGRSTIYETYAQLVAWIKNTQYEYTLKQKGLHDRKRDFDKEVSFTLFANQSDQEPRYTFYLTKCPDGDVDNDGNHKFAAFIVPLGREGEWLFNTPKGRVTLAKSARFERLIIVHLNRNHTYPNMDAIKVELSPAIERYRPDDVSPEEKILILSLGDDTLERKIVERGSTACSGYEYLVEDVKLAEHDFWLRRLYFLNAPSLIQSEIRLHGSDKAILKPEIMGPLQFEHHKAMLTAMVTTFPDLKSDIDVLIIGLGGGALPTFLHTFLPLMDVKVVEIDEKIVSVASRLFGYEATSSPTSRTEIVDGLCYLSTKQTRFDCIIIDVNSNDPSEALSSPPPNFITPQHLELFKISLKDNGLLMTTLLTRDPQEIGLVEEAFSQTFQAPPYTRVLVDLGDEELDKVIQVSHDPSGLPSRETIERRHGEFGQYLRHVLEQRKGQFEFELGEYMFDLETYLSRKIF